MIKYLSTSHLILIVSFLTLQGENLASASALTCPNELASYQQCIANQPLYCFPTCGKVEVKVNPGNLAYMMDPSYRCDPMKLASCAMRGCCERCAAQEAIYWSCIERESGCGEIDCKVILGPTDGDTSTEPQDEDVPLEEDEVSAPITGGSNGQVTGTADEDESTGDAPTVVDDGTNEQPPLENDTDSETNSGNSNGASDSDTIPVDSNTSTSEDLTCPGELGLFKQCVSSNSCAPSCANVDMTLKAEDLTNTVDPSILCTPMKVASCAQRSCCEDCALEEFLYWFCIERETGCGAIDCRDVPSLVNEDVSSEPQVDENPPVENNEVTTPATGGSDATPVNNTYDGDATPSESGCDCQNTTTKPSTGGSDEQDVPPASDEATGYEAPSDNDTTNGQYPPQTTTPNENTPTVNVTSNSSTNQDSPSGEADSTNNAPVGSNTPSSNSGGLTCPNELASYQQCIANQPLYCFPTCGKVEVKVNPGNLAYMMDPSYRCDPMKLASCAMRGCCERCAAQEAIYWSCIERESGCGEIDCKVILGPTDGDRTSTTDLNTSLNAGVAGQPEFSAIEATGNDLTSGVSQNQKIVASFAALASLLVYMDF